ncbi:hypothetical protein BVRB_2g047490 [Beta vulgaris subsp. vulgaris]|uniref:Autophagy-related protein n=1 Tax=Beta vulgaris subsp. vulgaris TaxID=3555 RepID=A0A0J8BE12_BETVV|nr:hypothetical protein BVRB_2g047490 [Beta vulgaris subsp. vulgaris]
MNFLMDHRRHKDGSFDEEGEAKFNEFKKLHEKEIQENGIDNISIDEAYMMVLGHYSGANERGDATRVREKYPDKIPVIVEKAERSDIPNINKKKYLVPADLTVGQFVYVIRRRIKLSADKAIFIFVDNVLPSTGAIMSATYEEKKDEDGFLYVTYSGENTFGYLVVE